MQDLFVGRDDLPNAVHGVDDLGGFVGHGGGILPDDCFLTTKVTKYTKWEMVRFRGAE